MLKALATEIQKATIKRHWQSSNKDCVCFGNSEAMRNSKIKFT